MIQLEDMRAFMEVVDNGGVNRTAARLGLSKSILSRRIAALEADLGVQLLIRSTRGVVATEAGREFRSRCERILVEVAEAREAVIGNGADMTGRLRVTAPQAFGQKIVAPLLAEMAFQHSKLQIDAVFTDRIVDLVGEGFDLAIRIGEPHGASLVGRRLAPVRAVLVASPAYLSRAGVPSAPADLHDHQCLSYSGGGDWKLRLGRRWVTVRPSGRLRSDSGDVIVQWTVAGLGVGNVPHFLIADRLAAGELIEVLPEFPQPEYGIYALRPPGTRAATKVSLLIDALSARLMGQQCCSL
jgi:DNA-binding transcriptional LysR family regulator